DVGAYATVFAPFGETLRGDWIRMYWLGRGARTEVPVQVAVNGGVSRNPRKFRQPSWIGPNPLSP
ncbi:hypothetical protein, partial [Pseudomonas sp. MF7451]|uniref:hypothetical protein n=1 Tax=Pseudomonas sp. MF7451 TaxID=2797538 RepID=UPI001E44BFFE